MKPSDCRRRAKWCSQTGRLLPTQSCTKSIAALATSPSRILTTSSAAKNLWLCRRATNASPVTTRNGLRPGRKTAKKLTTTKCEARVHPASPTAHSWPLDDGAVRLDVTSETYIGGVCSKTRCLRLCQRLALPCLPGAAKTITFPLLDLLCFLGIEIRHWAAERCRLHLQGRIEGKEDAAPNHALDRRADNHRAMAPHQGRWMISKCIGERATKRLVADQHVG